MAKMTVAEIRTNAKEIAFQKIMNNELSEMRTYGNESYIPVTVENQDIWVRMTFTVPNWKKTGEKEAFDIEEVKAEYEFHLKELAVKEAEKARKKAENEEKRKAAKKKKEETEREGE